MFSSHHSRTSYLLQAQLAMIEASATDFDDAKAGRPAERRFNRIERVFAAYRG